MIRTLARHAINRLCFYCGGIVCVVLSCICQCLQAQHAPSVQFHKAYYTVYRDTCPPIRIPTVELAGRYYIEPYHLAQMLHAELRSYALIVELATSCSILRFAVDAHNAVIESRCFEKQQYVGQMLHPVVLFARRVYLPFDAVLRVIADNGLYEIDEHDTTIYITTYSLQQREIVSDKMMQVRQDSVSTQHSISAEQNSIATKPVSATARRYTLRYAVHAAALCSVAQVLRNTNVRGSTTTTTVQKATTIQRSNMQPNILKQHHVHSTGGTAKKAVLPTLKVHDDKVHAQAQHRHDVDAIKKKWALDVIVLDAGHGGKDAGAIGVTNVKEKDITLSIVKKLGAKLQKELPGTKIVYTRTDDTFVELDRRGQIANEHGGKLFISIHCNATPQKPTKANGFEVYILRPGRNEDAVRVAEMENSVIRFEDNPKRYKPLTDEEFILVSMAQSAFVKYSDMAAAMITAEVKKLREIGVRGVNQAGFLVLVGASMPNMLIEVGFLSNKKDERYLKSERGQNHIASAICRAIKAYRLRYEMQMKEKVLDNVQKSILKSAATTATVSPKPTVKTMEVKKTAPTTTASVHVSAKRTRQHNASAYTPSSVKKK